MKPLHILYVDDDEMLREVAELCLCMEPGVDVSLAASGPEALGMLISGAVKPDVILLDVMMPAMDGPQTLAAIRKLGVTVPAAYITARARPEEQAQLLGADAIITKPFDPMTLGAKVRALADAADAAA